jgi:hypothetical protein
MRASFEDLVPPVSPEVDTVTQRFAHAFDAVDSLSIEDRLLVLITMTTVLAHELACTGVDAGRAGAKPDDLYTGGHT